MATEGPDLYENLQIRYPHVLDFGSRPSPSRRVQGTLLAVGLAALLALGAALTAVATLRARDQAELRVARAELEALGPLLPPGPDGECARRHRGAGRAVPRLLSLLSPGQVHGAPVTAPTWHRGAGTFWGGGCRGWAWAGGTTRGRSTTSRGTRSPGARRRSSASPSRRSSPPSPAGTSRSSWRGSRGGAITGSGWRTVTATTPGAGWTAPCTHRPTASGRRGSRTGRTTGSRAARAAPRSTRWAPGSGTTTTATSPSSGSASGTWGGPERPRPDPAG